jgi:hypothetical protein
MILRLPPPQYRSLGFGALAQDTLAPPRAKTSARHLAASLLASLMKRRRANDLQFVGNIFYPAHGVTHPELQRLITLSCPKATNTIDE